MKVDGSPTILTVWRARCVTCRSFEDVFFLSVDQREFVKSGLVKEAAVLFTGEKFLGFFRSPVAVFFSRVFLPFYTHPVRFFNLAMEIKRVSLWKPFQVFQFCLPYWTFDLEKVI